MSIYEPNSCHLREISIFCFNVKKYAAEAHRMLSNTYSETDISERTCREWLQRFKNGDFDIEDRHGGRREVFKELETLFHENSCQTQKELAESLGMIQQAISKRLKGMRVILERQRWKGFLHRIVTEDEKWIHYDNHKRRKSWHFPAMLPRLRANRIFTVQRSCFVFGETSSV